MSLNKLSLNRNRRRNNLPPKKILAIDWDHSDHLSEYDSQEEKIEEKHSVRKTDVEEALFAEEFQPVIIKQENSGDYEGPVYFIVNKITGGRYLFVVVIHIGNGIGIILTSYFLNGETNQEIAMIKKYADSTGGG